MPEYDYESFLNSTLDGKLIDFSDAFHDVMIDKLNNAINNRKVEIAQNMFRTVNPPQNIDIEDTTEE